HLRVADQVDGPPGDPAPRVVVDGVHRHRPGHADGLALDARCGGDAGSEGADQAGALGVDIQGIGAQVGVLLRGGGLAVDRVDAEGAGQGGAARGVLGGFLGDGDSAGQGDDGRVVLGVDGDVFAGRHGAPGFDQGAHDVADAAVVVGVGRVVETDD